MELKEAIETVKEWIKVENEECLRWGGDARMDATGQRYYDMHVAKWNAFQQVLELLSNVEGE
jgi:hypothetical protein